MELSTLVLLACPIGMGLMMWMMMRGDSHQGDGNRDEEIGQLRSEVDELRSAQQRSEQEGRRSN